MLLCGLINPFVFPPSLLAFVTELPENPTQIVEEAPVTTGLNGSCSSTNSSSSNGSTSCSVFASLFASSTAPASLQTPQTPAFTDLIRAMARPASWHGPC